VPRCSHVLRCLLLVVMLAVAPGAASAKHLSKKQRAKISQQLRREVRRHPRALMRRSFLRRAGLVDFRLPVTLVLRTGDDPSTPNVDESATRNMNRAVVDLGASLGQREVDLGGRLAAEIVFSDAYDGGALGTVKIHLLPSATKALQTTSIPLVWNDRVWTDSSTRWDANAVNDLINAGRQVTTPGCGDFDSSTTDPTRAIAGNLLFARGYLPVAGGPGLPGYPLNQAADGTNPAPGEQNYDPNNTNIPEGFLPQQSGIDTPTRLKAARNPGDPMALGGNPSPFPYPISWTPGGFQQPPSVADTVLRTAPLTLQVAPPGTKVSLTGVPASGGDPNGANGADNIVIGQSGGEANLFGRIPGKSYGIDVTASFATRINSIIRIVDQDLTGRNLIEGEPWPAGVFGCRQVYTGFVDNYLPGIHLRGNLRIAPAITSDGHLRIATATVSSAAPTQVAVAACVSPMASFQKPNDAPGENRSDAPAGSYTEYDDNLPSPFSTGVVLQPLDPLLFPQYTGGMEPLSELPVDLNHIRDRPPARPCNTPADRLVQESAMQPETVPLMAPAVPSNGYTTTANGSTITVAADLDVTQVTLDVLVGDQPAPPSSSPSGGSGGLPLLGGILDPIAALLPPVLIPPIIPSLPTVPAPSVPDPPITVPTTTVPTVPITVPTVTTTVPTVTTTIPDVTVTTPTTTVPVTTTTVPGVTTTVPGVTTTVPVTTTTIPEVTTTVPTVTTTIPDVTTTVPTTTIPVTTTTIPGVTTTVPGVTTTVPTVTTTIPTTTVPVVGFVATSPVPATPTVSVKSQPSVFTTKLPDPLATFSTI
jgi:hypothetical protein